MAQDMTFNAHLSVLSGVIIGLAIVRLLQGILWMIQDRQRIKVYWVHLWWVVFTIIGGTVHYFSIGWNPGAVVAGNFWRLPEFLLAPLLIYLLAGLLFPPSDEEGSVDLQDFYYENHAWFFGTFAIIYLIPTVQDVATSQIRLTQLPIYLGLLLVGALAVTRNKWFHMAVPIIGWLFLLATLLS
jgi:hypothetical protein